MGELGLVSLHRVGLCDFCSSSVLPGDQFAFLQILQAEYSPVHGVFRPWVYGFHNDQQINESLVVRVLT